MKRISIIVTSLMLTVLICSCSKRIFEASEGGKMHDEYFLLRKNGHYSFKILALGVFRMPDHQRGRYILSNDTVYFVNKKSKSIFSMYGYGIIDSSAGTFVYKYNDSLKWNTLEIREMPTRRRDRQNGY